MRKKNNCTLCSYNIRHIRKKNLFFIFCDFYFVIFIGHYLIFCFANNKIMKILTYLVNFDSAVFCLLNVGSISWKGGILDRFHFSKLMVQIFTGVENCDS